MHRPEPPLEGRCRRRRRRGDCFAPSHCGHLSVGSADSHTVAAKRFPVPGGPANRAASSKPARFLRRWRRFAGFPLKGSLFALHRPEPPLEGRCRHRRRRGDCLSFSSSLLGSDTVKSVYYKVIYIIEKNAKTTPDDIVDKAEDNCRSRSKDTCGH